MSLVQFYRKTYGGQLSKRCTCKAVTRLAPSPVSPLDGYTREPGWPAQPRHRDRVTNVQRWKVLRDRNRKLPKLDFNSKAAGSSKKCRAGRFPGGSYARSYTHDSIKLPYLSTSHVTSVTRTNDNDLTRRWDQPDTKGNIQETGSLTDMSKLGGLHDIHSTLSKSLNNLAESSDDPEPGTKHRYQRISCSKQISNRKSPHKPNGTNELDSVQKGESTKLDTAAALTHENVNEPLKEPDPRRQPHKDSYTSSKSSTKKDNIYSAYKMIPELIRYPKPKPTLTPEKTDNEKSELKLLEKSSILYQIDLTRLRNYIPPLSSPPSSVRTEVGVASRRGKYGRSPVAVARRKGGARRQKWRDGCQCLRCGMMQ